MASNTYVVNLTAVSVSGAVTLIQVKAGATVPLEIIRASVWQSGSTTSTMQRIQLLRKTSANTSMTSFTPLKMNPNDPAANAAGGTSATSIYVGGSSEGSDGDILVNEVFNILNGWLYLPVPEERPWVAAAGILGLKFPAAPGSALTVTAQVVFRELG